MLQIILILIFVCASPNAGANPEEQHGVQPEVLPGDMRGTDQAGSGKASGQAGTGGGFGDTAGVKPIVGGVSDNGQATRGSFSEASGLEVEVAPVEYRTGTEDEGMGKLPGIKKSTNIERKRGIVPKNPEKIFEGLNRVQSWESPGPEWQRKFVMMPQTGPPEWIRSRVTSWESPGDDYEMEIVFMPRTGPPTWVPKGSQGLRPVNPATNQPPPADGR